MTIAFLCTFLLSFNSISRAQRQRPRSTSSADVCSMPAAPGRCRGQFERYFFNSETGQCELFIYGGCGGNDNNFLTLEACEARCGSVDICSLPVEVGPCKASFPKFFYNSETGQCESFIYGGCDGNANNFETLEACESECPGDSGVDICSLPTDVGPCDAVVPRFTYNTDTQQCESFDYGGCDGNANNFENLGACLTECAVAGDTCGTPGVECPSLVLSPGGTTLCPDGLTCYDNCGTCTAEDDRSGGLTCSALVDEDRVCVGCGINHCVGYYDGCNNCFCSEQADGTFLEGCTEMACKTYLTPECTACEEGYTLNTQTKKCELA
eukprot:CAMPEP_0202733638 /NCGR_PEP_ID=MMETSP1385-20130828/188272_1 /ASSEMBLY_ACC=CAM_ASM_000861 /TAXON_ID=933848 /ORGANISM="Elphidium margaritaceum" /LENGTH=324 /DNA_ID=CAMNT_0049399977 /DNA_START=68 /DNA_END=1042 /DNA_ORIENTATION=-